MEHKYSYLAAPSNDKRRSQEGTTFARVNDAVLLIISIELAPGSSVHPLNLSKYE